MKVSEILLQIGSKSFWCWRWVTLTSISANIECRSLCFRFYPLSTKRGHEITGIAQILSVSSPLLWHPNRVKWATKSGAGHANGDNAIDLTRLQICFGRLLTFTGLRTKSEAEDFPGSIQFRFGPRKLLRVSHCTNTSAQFFLQRRAVQMIKI